MTARSLVCAGSLLLLSTVPCARGEQRTDAAPAARFQTIAERSLERQAGSILRQRRQVVRRGITQQLAAAQKQLAAAQGAPKPFLNLKRIRIPAARPAVTGACSSLGTGTLSSIVADSADRHGLSPELLYSVIHRESAFNPCAVSYKGALGLMQLMPGTAAELGVQNPFDPRENVDGGARYLKRMLASFDGDLSLALAAYNAGPGAVERYDGTPPYRETQNYVSAILRSLGVRERGSD